MKAIRNTNEKKEEFNIEADSLLELVIKSIMKGRIEIPELTAHFQKRFDNEAKQQEFNSMVQS